MNVEAPSRVTRWPLLRVEPGHDVEVRLLSGDWVRLATHYVGRTMLCSEDEVCPLCHLTCARSFWYLPAAIEPHRRPALVELSAAASSQLEQCCRFGCGSIGAGIVLRLSRRSPKRPISSEFVTYEKPPTQIGLTEWVTLLMAVYQMPPLRVGESIETYGSRIRDAVVSRAELAADRLRAKAKK